MENGLFPHSRSVNSEEALEEERRLCYVGMTRARKRLILSWARYRRRFGGGEAERSAPSPFLGEVPEHLVVNMGPQDDEGEINLHAERYDARQSARRNTYTGKTHNSLDSISQFFGDRGMEFNRPGSSALSGNRGSAPPNRPSGNYSERPPSAPMVSRPASSNPSSSNYAPRPSNSSAPTPSKPPAGRPAKESESRQGSLYSDDTPSSYSERPAPSQGRPPEHSGLSRSSSSQLPRPQGSTAPLPSAPPPPRKIARTGMTVNHPKYGAGTVVKREGEGDDAKITVNFPRFGLKKLIEKYAGLKRD
jgi:DNA helicase-2/ATP-dependent DNA helicase PcrA